MKITPDIEKLIEKTCGDYQEFLQSPYAHNSVHSKLFDIIKTLIESLPRYDWSKAPEGVLKACTLWICSSSFYANPVVVAQLSDEESRPTPPPWKPTVIGEPYLWRINNKHEWQPLRYTEGDGIGGEYRPFDLELMFRMEATK